jgi:hypothetical protein
MSGQDHLLAKAFLATGGAAYVYGQCVTLAAGTALDPNQMVITPITARGITTPAYLGLVQENLDLVKVATGKAYASVALAGVGFGIADGAVAIGAMVCHSVVTAGQLHAVAKTAAGSAPLPIMGMAMTTATTAGDIFSVLLMPGATF